MSSYSSWFLSAMRPKCVFDSDMRFFRREKSTLQERLGAWVNKGLGGSCLFHTIIITFIQYINYPSPFAEASLLCLLCLFARNEKHPWGAEPGFELGPAIQQASALPMCELIHLSSLEYERKWKKSRRGELLVVGKAHSTNAGKVRWELRNIECKWEFLLLQMQFFVDMKKFYKYTWGWVNSMCEN